MQLEAFLAKLNAAPASVGLEEALSVIARHHDFTPCGYTLGGVRFGPEKTRSTQIYAFGLLHKLSQEQTLHCFGVHYREDVLPHPQGSDHQTVRLFLQHGWAGLKLDDPMPLKRRP